MAHNLVQVPFQEHVTLVEVPVGIVIAKLASALPVAHRWALAVTLDSHKIECWFVNAKKVHMCKYNYICRYFKIKAILGSVYLSIYQSIQSNLI